MICCCCLPFLFCHAELDAKALTQAISKFDAIDAELRRLGKLVMLLGVVAFIGNFGWFLDTGFSAVDLRAFRSGSLSGYNADTAIKHKSAASSQARHGD